MSTPRLSTTSIESAVTYTESQFALSEHYEVYKNTAHEVHKLRREVRDQRKDADSKISGLEEEIRDIKGQIRKLNEKNYETGWPSSSS
jgi:TolA-binding protein